MKTLPHRWLCAALLALAALGAQAQGLDLEGLPSTEVTLIAATGASHRVQAWVAANPERRETGLMYVTALPADRGMLFLYPEPLTAGMWMKNTLVPLDMLFIAEDGRITDIAAHTRPQSLRVHGSSEPVLAVLELNAGTAEPLGLRAGDRVEFDRRLRNAAW